VVIDVCAGHGAWFDRGEFERALRFVAEGGFDGGSTPPGGAARGARLARAAAELRVALAAEAASDLRRERRAHRIASWLVFDVLGMLGFGPRRP
jgi:hypothetical protein